MSIYFPNAKSMARWPWLAATLLLAGQARMLPAEEPTDPPPPPAVEHRHEAEASGPSHSVVIEAIEPIKRDTSAARKNQPWLGVSTEEASEALTAQLGLEAGVGLVITYVAPDSPAAKAGLRKNDVLAELDGQALVLPAQLRKLILARKAGDSLKLVFYRGGQKHHVSTALIKSPAGWAEMETDRPWLGEIRVLQQHLRDMPVREALHERMTNLHNLRETLGNLKIDQQKLQQEIRRSMEQARQAVQEALRNSPKANATLGSAHKALQDLARNLGATEKHASVTVRNTGETVKSIIKADDSGTIVIVSNPKPHLTVHDPNGKLVYDGEIETSDQRAKVPPELWTKVEPLLKKVAPQAEKELEAEDGTARHKAPLPEDDEN